MRLIDADAIPYAQGENGVLDDYAYRYDINELPTIEAEPVNHGRWLDMETEPKCSVCGKYSVNDKYATMHYAYCPHCGAKMDGDAE